MIFVKKHKQDIAGFAVLFLIVFEIAFLMKPFLLSPSQGTYKGKTEYLELSKDTYHGNGRKGFYYFSESVPQGFAEYGRSALCLDTGDVYGIKSAFVIVNTKTGESLVNNGAIFIQILIVTAFCVAVYFAFVQKDKPKNKKIVNEDDDWNTDLLKDWKKDDK